MTISRPALAVMLIYVVIFAAAFLATVGIDADAVLLEESGYASNVTVPFSILSTAILSVLGIDLFASNFWAYVVWIPSAVANAVIVYMLSKRTFDMLEGRPQSATVTQS